MVLYNSVMGLIDGVLLILVALLLRSITPDGLVHQDKRTGFGSAMLGGGALVSVLGLAMVLTWPLGRSAPDNFPMNKFFGEPSLMIGLLSVGAGVVLLRGRSQTLDVNRYRPVTLLIASVGAYASAMAVAAWQFGLVRPAPVQEPIFSDIGQAFPWLDNLVWGITYAAIGVCAMLSLLWHRQAVRKVCWIVLAVFGAYILARSVVGGGYAQIGMLVRFRG